MTPPDAAAPPPPPAPPRFVPTLTESLGARQAAPQPASAPAAPPSPIEERIARALLAELGPQLDQLIGETVARVIHEQMLGLPERIRAEVARTLRDEVAQRLLAHGADWP